MSGRRRPDFSRMAKMAERPGVDPRVWLTFAVVTELGFDATGGIFADVQYVPTGEQETALIGAGYAGNGFGDYCPIEEEDIVLVAVPNGDSNMGPVIIARVWAAADHPSVDFKASEQVDGHDVPTSDRVIRVRSGQRLVIRTDGEGGDVDVRVEGSGNVNLFVDTGRVVLGGTGGEPGTKGTTLKAYLDANKVWQDAHVHIAAGATSPTGPAAAAATGPSPSVPVVSMTKVEGV